VYHDTIAFCLNVFGFYTQPARSMRFISGVHRCTTCFPSIIIHPHSTDNVLLRYDGGYTVNQLMLVLLGWFLFLSNIFSHEYHDVVLSNY